MTRLTRNFIIDLLAGVAAWGAAGGGCILGMIVADRIGRGSSLSMDARYWIAGVGAWVFAAIGCFVVYGPYLYFRFHRKPRKRS